MPNVNHASILQLNWNNFVYWISNFLIYFQFILANTRIQFGCIKVVYGKTNKLRRTVEESEPFWMWKSYIKMLSVGEFGESENEQGILSFLFILIKLVLPRICDGALCSYCWLCCIYLISCATVVLQTRYFSFLFMVIYFSWTSYLLYFYYLPVNTLCLSCKIV